MRVFATATMFALLAAGAHAQTTPAQTVPAQTTPVAPSAAPAPAPATPVAPARPARRRMTLQQRFEAANTTQDGHLTLDQAKTGHMRFEVVHFGEIDTTSQGYITLDQIHTFMRARRAARRAASSPKN